MTNGSESIGVDPAIEVPGASVSRLHQPSTIAEVGDIVAEASRERRGLLIVGGRTRLRCANAARGIGAGVSTGGLDGVDEFEPEEGVLHARAGTPIGEIRRIASAEGWELPLDTPGANSTLGGTLATGSMGPRAMAFGRVQDAVLGLDVVGGDGVASKCGGRVVKNVTGYDMAKLYCGSFGSLAVITGAWLRLRPAPAVRDVLAARAELVSFESVRRLAALESVRALVWNQESESERAEVVLELAGSEEGVANDRREIADVLDLSVETDPADDRVDVLRDARVSFGDDPIALRARVPGTECEALTREILRAGFSVSVDPGLGVVFARGALSTPDELLAIRERSSSVGGFATFEKMPSAWREGLDVFGEADGTVGLMSNLKKRFDPMGILNPGRFMAGI